MRHDITTPPIRGHVGVHVAFAQTFQSQNKYVPSNTHTHAGVPGQLHAGRSRILEYVDAAIAADGESARVGAYVRVCALTSVLPSIYSNCRA